ncbi:MAG: hypothetical protein ACR2HY_05980 [Acidimicrobiales bacterium]
MIYAAALLRPEAWPFLGLYGAWLWRREPRWRLTMCVGVALLPVLWFGPDLVGSGNAWRSLHRAEVPTQAGPLLASHPGIALLASTTHYLSTPFALAAIVAAGSLVWGVVGPGRPGRSGYDGTTLAILVVTAAWLAIEVATTQAGRSSGDQRYLIVAGSGASVLAGIGWGRTLQAGKRVVARLSQPIVQHSRAGSP